MNRQTLMAILIAATVAAGLALLLAYVVYQAQMAHMHMGTSYAGEPTPSVSQVVAARSLFEEDDPGGVKLLCVSLSVGQIETLPPFGRVIEPTPTPWPASYSAASGYGSGYGYGGP